MAVAALARVLNRRGPREREFLRKLAYIYIFCLPQARQYTGRPLAPSCLEYRDKRTLREEYAEKSTLTRE